jgi:hypothetical protein
MHPSGEIAEVRLEGPLTEEANSVYEAHVAVLAVQKNIEGRVPGATREDLYNKQDTVDEVVDTTNIPEEWREETYLRAYDAVMPEATKTIKVPTAISAIMLATLLHVAGKSGNQIPHQFRRQAFLLKALRRAKNV